MEMGDSLILIPPPLPLPPKKKTLNQNQQFSDSELFEKPNRRFFINSNNCTTLGTTQEGSLHAI